MKRFVAPVFAGALCLAPAIAQGGGSPDPAWAPHRSTRVLYAGWPGGSREKAFEAFLKQWFDKVSVIDLQKLTMAAAKDYDVVIADWCSQYGMDGYAKRENSLFTPKVKLGDDFTRPVIAMDYVSSTVRANGKLDWL
jgi:hypothetical protein